MSFFCRHRNRGFPITIQNRTYWVCFDCAGEFDYSLFADQVPPSRRLEGWSAERHSTEKIQRMDRKFLKSVGAK